MGGRGVNRIRPAIRSPWWATTRRQDDPNQALELGSTIPRWFDLIDGIDLREAIIALRQKIGVIARLVRYHAGKGKLGFGH